MLKVLLRCQHPPDPLLQPVSYTKIALFENEPVMFGGGPGSVTKVFKYNVAGMNWVELDPLPEPAMFYSVVIADS